MTTLGTAIQIFACILLLVGVINAICCLYKDITNTTIAAHRKVLFIIGEVFIIIIGSAFIIISAITLYNIFS